MKKNSLFLIFIIIGLEAFFFRHLFIYNTLIGDSSDGLLNNLIVEHWYDFYCGRTTLMDLPIFYPIHNTFSYSDMLMAFSLPYSILRSVGLNMFISNEITLILFHFLGALSLFYLAHKKMKLSLTASFICLFVTFYSSAFYNKICHTQFFALGLLPLLMIFIFNIKDEYLRKQVIAKRYCFLTLLLLALLLYTSWYIGFFTCLFALIYFIVYAVIHNDSFYCTIYEVRKHYKVVLLMVLCEVLLLIPFAKAYLPTKALTGTWEWQVMLPMLPQWFDFFNVSGNNVFYGKIFGLPYFYGRPAVVELYLGFGFFTFFMFILSSVYYVKFRKINRYTSTICIAVWISLLLILKIDNMSLWYIVYKFIPGGSAVRAVSRYMFFLSFPAGLVIARYWDDFFKSGIKKHLNIAVLLIPILLFAENINTLGYDKNYNTPYLLSFINGTSTPGTNLPMYIVDTSKNKNVPPYGYQLKAWMIANKYRLDTVNGYASKFPKRWECFPANDEKYEDHINDWMILNNISFLQEYDIATNKWNVRGVQQVKGILFVDGWHQQENWGCWTAEQSSVVIVNKPSYDDNDLIMELQTSTSPHNVTVSADNIIIARFLVAERETFICKLPDALKNKKDITITLFTGEELKSPKELGQSEDSRKLGIGISKIALKNIGL